MKERLMVRGKRHWVADKDGKVLLGNYDTYKDARMALVEMERKDKENDMFVPRFYTIVEGVLGALRRKGYTPIEDILLCTDL